MIIGSLKQKASEPLVYFVFVCIIVITGLLYVTEKSFTLADALVYDHGVYHSVDE
jgi:Cu/Ag efflux pump CusA